MRIRRGRTRRRRRGELMLNLRTALWFTRRLWRPALKIAVVSVRLPRRPLLKR